MSYPLSEIASVIGARVTGNTNPEAPVSQLLIDSRKLVQPETSLFFAIKGERHDAHRFISDLYEKGVRNFVVSSLPQHTEKFGQASFLFVDDTLDALQKLSAWHRRHFHIPVIGITGSNGKTIVKEWLYQLLREDKHIVRSPKSFN
ncbi:MAG TPA: bifunctional UDP-N-acetylmuramoyl-tripeptide:D-alanyl-D-alanine ligase/alanine racemase, partial [Bacteroidia bacterium]|nr:bifunctional UDP-N-acetylmuramoyl-tripeptide:D-alanyl-D-alanine ligase/alanine racemase [Bacteroidia bacterium]